MNCVCSQCRNWQPPDGTAAPRDEFAEAAGLVGMYALLVLVVLGLTIWFAVGTWGQPEYKGTWIFPAFKTAAMVVVPLGCLALRGIVVKHPYLAYLGPFVLGALILGLACIFG